MFESILNLLIPVANIIEKDVPGFAQRTQIQINNLRVQYVAEVGKSSDSIDDAKLDNLYMELCDLIELFHSSIQQTDAATESK